MGKPFILTPSEPCLMPTRALSLIQPWAWAVTRGGKNIENRTWWTEFRGPIWIAASAQVTRRYYDQARDLILGITGGRLEVPALADLEYGKIIGRTVIVDCILPGGFAFETKAKASAARSNHLCGMAAGKKRHPLDPQRWHFQDQFGYVLDETRAVTQVPCKGLQRLWTVPCDVLEALAGSP